MNTGVRVAAAQSALERISVFCRNLSAMLLALMAMLIAGQVVGRNVFDLGLPWADELARFCGIALVFLCVPLLALRGQLVSVDLVPQSLPPRPRRIALMITEFTSIAFCAMALVGFQSFLSRAWKFATPAIGLPNWMFYAPALMGIALFLMVSVLRFLVLLGEAETAGENHNS